MTSRKALYYRSINRRETERPEKLGINSFKERRKQPELFC
jgi:hypothetical protein